MKAKTKLIELALCVVCAGAAAALPALHAGPVAAAVKEPGRVDRADRQTIEGEVSAKSDTTLTVAGKVIAITATTSFMKDGKSIFSGDVQNGDSVKVLASRGTEGPLVAESVEVLVKK